MAKILVVCPECKGAKFVTYEGEGIYECPTCGGEGVVSPAEAFAYQQERREICTCPAGLGSVEVMDGERRCTVCGMLAAEVG